MRPHHDVRETAILLFVSLLIKTTEEEEREKLSSLLEQLIEARPHNKSGSRKRKKTTYP